MSVIADVEQFILTDLGLGATMDAIPPGEELLSTGIIDSHGLMELIAFLGERYGVTVPDDDLAPENFQTLERIDAYVARARS